MIHKTPNEDHYRLYIDNGNGYQLKTIKYTLDDAITALSDALANSKKKTDRYFIVERVDGTDNAIMCDFGRGAEYDSSMKPKVKEKK